MLGMPEPELDLVLRGGEVVNAGGSERADVGIAGGVVTRVGGGLRGREEIDATGRVLLPGAVDAHVHLSSPPGAPTEGPRWGDDFASGSRAALAGGGTAGGHMTVLGEGGAAAARRHPDVPGRGGAGARRPGARGRGGRPAGDRRRRLPPGHRRGDGRG